jgi:hypothetical protein
MPLLRPAGPPYLDGETIGSPASYPQFRVRVRRMVDHREADDGTVREYARYNGGIAYPMYREKRQFDLDWASLSESAAAQLDRILAAPGPYDLAVWQHVTVAYLADGTRYEWVLPWRLAPDFYTLPGGQPATRFAPEVRIDGGEPLTVFAVDDATYDGDDPDTDEVWTRFEGTDWKLGTVPSEASVVTVAAVPLFRVLQTQPERERQHRADLRLPTQVILREV